MKQGSLDLDCILLPLMDPMHLTSVTSGTTLPEFINKLNERCPLDSAVGMTLENSHEMGPLLHSTNRLSYMAHLDWRDLHWKAKETTTTTTNG